MRHNVGTVDRVLRAIVGIALLSYSAIGSGSARWLGLIGFVPLLTAVVGFCPAYLPFGFSTCAKKAES